MISELYKKHNYLNKEITFINNSKITEYDMSNAGLNILYFNEIFTTKEYNKLLSMSKLDRNVTIGKFLKNNPEINEILMEGFIEVRRVFFESNNIKDEDVLSIKKDAIILINKFPKKLIFEDIFIFKDKGNFNSYLNINGKEHYYNIERNLLITKGYQEEVKKHHENFLFEFVKECLKYKYINDNNRLFEYLALFKNDFIELNLPKEFYKDIIHNGYLVNIVKKYFLIDDIDESNKDILVINNNLNFILELIYKLI